MSCPHCQSQSIAKNGKYSLQDGTLIQHYQCKACKKRFSDKTGTPMARLRTSTARRYAAELWKLASVRLKYREVCAQYGHLKVWRQGLEVAIKIKGSQGKPRVESVKPEHPFTAISLCSD